LAWERRREGRESYSPSYREIAEELGLGAVQLCTLPWLGFVPEDAPAAPAAIVARLSDS
jgi:hypothetical protein